MLSQDGSPFPHNERASRAKTKSPGLNWVRGSSGWSGETGENLSRHAVRGRGFRLAFYRSGPPQFRLPRKEQARKRLLINHSKTIGCSGPPRSTLLCAAARGGVQAASASASVQRVVDDLAADDGEIAEAVERKADAERLGGIDVGLGDRRHMRDRPMKVGDGRRGVHRLKRASERSTRFRESCDFPGLRAPENSDAAEPSRSPRRRARGAIPATDFFSVDCWPRINLLFQQIAVATNSAHSGEGCNRASAHMRLVPEGGPPLNSPRGNAAGHRRVVAGGGSSAGACALSATSLSAPMRRTEGTDQTEKNKRGGRIFQEEEVMVERVPGSREEDAWLSDEQLEHVAPAESEPFQGPVPTRMISNGEYMPFPQTQKQKQVEERVKELA